MTTVIYVISGAQSLHVADMFNIMTLTLWLYNVDMVDLLANFLLTDTKQH